MRSDAKRDEVAPANRDRLVLALVIGGWGQGKRRRQDPAASIHSCLSQPHNHLCPPRPLGILPGAISHLVLPRLRTVAHETPSALGAFCIICVFVLIKIGEVNFLLSNFPRGVASLPGRAAGPRHPRRLAHCPPVVAIGRTCSPLLL